MPQTATSRRASRRTLRPGVLPLLIAALAILGALVYQSLSSPARSFSEPGPRVAIPRSEPMPTTTSAVHRIGEDDGVLPDGVTAADDDPGIANLDPDLRRALLEATRVAARDGIELDVNSGWRSAAYQDELLRDAVAEYGSAREAARWVATADTSPHVAGKAVDVGAGVATAWLARHGSAFGLCQVYRNEPWHYELRPAAIDDGCPHMYADPTRDPRMQR